MNLLYMITYGDVVETVLAVLVHVSNLLYFLLESDAIA